MLTFLTEALQDVATTLKRKKIPETEMMRRPLKHLEVTTDRTSDFCRKITTTVYRYIKRSFANY